MGSWTFLSNPGRVVLFLARDPGMRLRDIAARAAITERSTYGIVTDLAGAGYVVKQKDGRRNRYQIEAHLPLPRAHQPGTHGRRDPGPSGRPRRGAVTGRRTHSIRRSPAHRHHRRAVPGRREPAPEPRRQAAAAPRSGGATCEGPAVARRYRRGSRPFRPNIPSSVP
jgi:hypothetical protein